MGRASHADRLSTLATLNDATRRDLYVFVRDAGHAVSRDEAAAAMAMPRSTAVFHLDRLVDSGLLTVSYLRLTGRSGPGAGRPAKLYTTGTDDVTASVPDRDYVLAAHILAEAADTSARAGAPIRACVRGAAERAGHAIGAAATDLAGALDEHGFAPRARRGSLVLRNCPFRDLRHGAEPVVCELNHALVGAIAAACGGFTATPVPAAAPNGCCVRLDRNAGRPQPRRQRPG